MYRKTDEILMRTIVSDILSYMRYLRDQLGFEVSVHQIDAFASGYMTELRSFNNRSGHGSRLVISTFAQSLEPCDGGHFNRILLSGVLCKQPTLRRTPLGRSICDMILAVNRRYGRADYLPCIAWGKVAAKIAEMQVGDRLTLEGRVQSRTYIKQTDAGSEERTAYEVSVMQLLDDEETELI